MTENTIKPGSIGRFKYEGEEIPFPCRIANCGPQNEGSFIITTNENDLNKFQLHDSTHYSRLYYFVWPNNIGVIENVGKSDINVIGEGIFRIL